MKETNSHQYRALVVEDDRDISRLISQTLERAGFQISRAFDGRDALDRIAQHDFDLVILDVSMPYVSGIDVLRRIRANESLSSTSVIMVTSHDTNRDVMEAYTLGADLHFAKPFDPVQLVRSAWSLMRERAIA